jgi:outer membrane protein assembly factor BamB
VDDEFVQALDAKDGSQVWSTRIGKVGNPDQNPPYPGARSTPTVDAKLMYALGSDGDLACLETSSGQIQWQENLRTQFGGQPGVWAYSESPLVDGDVLVCTPGGAESTLVALNKNTGDLIWKCAVPGGDQAAYASVIVVEVGGVKQYVQFLQKGLVGVNAESGEFLWRYDRTAEGSPANIPTPVARDGYVYSAAGRSGGGLVKLNVDQGKVEAEEVYFDPKLPTSLGGAVLVGDHLYGTTGQGLVCAELITGEVKWQDRGIGPGSLCYADGRLYIHGENGDVALVEATPEAYRELGRLTLPDQPDRGRSRAWSHPVIANGRLMIRDLDTLWMYDIQDGIAGR